MASVSKIQDELISATEYVWKATVSDSDNRLELIKLADRLPDPEWDRLSPEAQQYCSTVSAAIKAQKPIPAPPDVQSASKAKAKAKAEPEAEDSSAPERGKTVYTFRKITLLNPDWKKAEVAAECARLGYPVTPSTASLLWYGTCHTRKVMQDLNMI